MKQASREKVKYAIAGILPVLTWVLLYLLVSALPSVDKRMRLPAASAIYLLMTVMLCIVSIYRPAFKFSLIWAGALIFLSFFMTEDVLWPAVIMWHKRYAFILAIEIVLMLVFAIAIIRISGLTIAAVREGFTNNQEPFFYKIVALPVLAFGVFLCWRALDRFVCTAIYQLPGKKVHITAVVTSNGSVKGKYYYHRYWNMTFANGGREKFWVYAAANTQDGYKCSTNPDPEPGAVVYITGRENVLGFAYERVDSIKTKNGERICPH
ncbi:hypothetical protein [Chitinophaga arvensicola]|uniref:Uncharacterized protein n=1 Tax=Chitinophaga arvensicola TaxID=29529 RepID=A0A1I0SC42_9BACT|nr:hypothetical protein [Chitinophaga arvensicola]SEW53158.1 hypothetical protein SAMN04488122_5356 [Chitinophaga arvensicola]